MGQSRSAEVYHSPPCWSSSLRRSGCLGAACMPASRVGVGGWDAGEVRPRLQGGVVGRAMVLSDALGMASHSCPQHVTLKSSSKLRLLSMSL